ncbi:MAG TPA: hypothetical protein VNR18_14405 [Hyphomicrobiales bacterium]|nr:hypothetical protein [Hyphomicrobiales bacterium]
MMKWKNVAVCALVSMLGIVGVNTYINGFSAAMLLLVGAVTLVGALLVGYVWSVGERAQK